MEIAISCDAYVRHSRVAKYLADEDERQYLRSIFIERKNGKVVIVSTNAKIAAIEKLPDSIGPDGFCNLIVDDALIAQCQTETAFHSNLNIVVNDILKFATIKTTLGYIHVGNGLAPQPEHSEFVNWREWFADELPKKTKGAMQASFDYLSVLAECSPSGNMVWQEFIDTSKPVIVQDIHNTDWVGLFLPRGKKNSNVTSATIPHWVSQ